MKKLRTLCVAVSVTVAVFSGIASATSQQSAPLKQTPAEGEILDLPELVARVKPSVVTILTYDVDGQPAGQGSGFFIAEDRIITNLHVIRGANRAELRLTSGTTIDIAGVLADDEGHDLALLQVDLTAIGTTVTIKPLRLADTIPKEGERIAVIGSPLGLAHTVSEGIVSAFREMPDRGTMIQITAAISPGSSGSPVFNMRGEVIAVARSIVVDAQSLNFAVAIEHVAAMQAGKLRRLSELDRQETEGSDEALQELARGVAAYLANDYQKALLHY
ncbi:MAG: serine protease, partial [Planctomycetes bacterium]|nr:serine protease [Planctomycetota bacterium]